MTKCRQCNITISDNTGVCPLCRCVVEASEHPTPVIGSYPAVSQKSRRLKHAANILLAVILAAGTVLAICNAAFYGGSLWCLIPIVAMAYGYMVFQLLISRKGYRIKVLVPMLLAILLTLIIDAETGFYRWSLNYVMPGMILAADIVIICLMLSNLKNWQSYIIMQIGMAAFSLLPLLLWWLDAITHPVISIIAFAVSLLLFVSMVIVGGRSAEGELKRRFHIR